MAMAVSTYSLRLCASRDSRLTIVSPTAIFSGFRRGRNVIFVATQIGCWKRSLCGLKAGGDVSLTQAFSAKSRRCSLVVSQVSDSNKGYPSEDEFGIPLGAIPDIPINHPQYVSYTDLNGEPSPTYGARPPLLPKELWSDDMGDKVRSAKAASPYDMPAKTSSAKTAKPGAKRKKTKVLSREEIEAERARKDAEVELLRAKFNEEDDVDASTTGSNDTAEEDTGGEKVPEELDSSQTSTALAPVDSVGEDLARATPLGNDELWWNWQEPPQDQKPWSAWQKRAGDTDTVMAAAMAETGQIKLYGDKPTIAEATLARARKHVFYEERMEAEETRKKKIGAMAYYKEWVKKYDGDVSKEAVQRRFEETGEEEGIQLLDMFSYQTRAEYRIMQGTDIRIRRDPLIMRMREDQIKQVWGGDPVYPTINYVQDPDHIADYRNPNMHEPVPNTVEMLRETGRLITQEELKKWLEDENSQEADFAQDDMLSGAVDIGDDEDDFDDDDDDESNFVKPVDKASRTGRSGVKKSRSNVKVLDDDDESEDEEEGEWSRKPIKNEVSGTGRSQGKRTSPTSEEEDGLKAEVLDDDDDDVDDEEEK